MVGGRGPWWRRPYIFHPSFILETGGIAVVGGESICMERVQGKGKGPSRLILHVYAVVVMVIMCVFGNVYG